MQTERPKVLTDEQRLDAAQRIADDLSTAGAGPDDSAQAASDIAQVATVRMDGFQLAKILESRCGWDIDFETVECLENHRYVLGEIMRQAGFKWVKENSIQPQFEIGAHIINQRDETGIITGISEHTPAAYEVALDNDPAAYGPTSARRIMLFEDVMKIEMVGEPV